MRTGLPFALLLTALTSTAAAAGDAPRVVLMRPDGADAVLVDAFHRVEAELRLHRFEPEVVAAEPEAPPSEALAQLAAASHALASIGFVRHAGKTSVEVWLVDRVSGKTTMRRLEVGKSRDAASVLAIRTVDLLRMSLSEYDPAQERPPPEIVDVERRPPPEAVRLLTAPNTTFRLRVEAMSLFEGPVFGFAYGPALGLYHVSRPLEIGVMVAGPLVGAKLETPLGDATMWQTLAWFDLRLALFESAQFDFALGAGAGVHWLRAHGQARSPLISQDDDLLSALLSLGAHADLDLSRSTAVTASARALGFLPGLGVAVASERAEIALPVVVASLGVAVAW